MGAAGDDVLWQRNPKLAELELLSAEEGNKPKMLPTCFCSTMMLSFLNPLLPSTGQSARGQTPTAAPSPLPGKLGGSLLQLACS
jgi:hypothetical protein